MLNAISLPLILAFVPAQASNTTESDFLVPLSLWARLDAAHHHTCEIFKHAAHDVLGAPAADGETPTDQQATPLAADAVQHLVALVQAYPGHAPAAQAAFEAALGGAHFSQQETRQLAAFHTCAPMTYLRVITALAKHAATSGDASLRRVLAAAAMVNARRQLTRPVTLIDTMVTATVLKRLAQAHLLDDGPSVAAIADVLEYAETRRRIMVERARAGTPDFQEDLRNTDEVRLRLIRAIGATAAPPAD